MSIGKFLGNISPVAGAVTGKGVFGKGLSKFQELTKMGGIMPMLAKSQREKLQAKRAEREADEKRAPASSRMKHGGKVKKMAKGGSTASKRADGCATKGKTRGKMV